MNKGHLAGLGFSIIFGFTFMLSKTALMTISPVGLIAYRFLVAAIAFEILRRTKLIRVRIEKANLKALMLVILFQPILYFLFESYGLQITTSGEAGMMIALIPIFATIFSTIILKEKPKLIQVFFIILSVSGIIFIHLSKEPTGIEGETLGFILLFGAVISAALYNIASRNASKTLKPLEITYFMMLFGAIIFNAIYLIQLFLTNNLTDYYQLILRWDLLGPILYLGIIASIGAFFLVNYALGQLEAHVISIYANLATIVAVSAGAIFLNETIKYYHYIGGAMIIIGVYGTVRLNRPKHRNKKIITPQIKA